VYFKVYHSDPPAFMGNDASALADFPRGFIHVANVEARNLDELFQKTNHIDSNWTLNPGVELARGVVKARSTSVGDVVVSEVEHRFSCEMIGWKAF
jgi:hypothetical protein